MNIKIESSTDMGLCQVPGCKNRWVCIWSPRIAPNKKLKVCAKHAAKNDEDDFLWDLMKLKKPEHVPKVKTVPKKEKVNLKKLCRELISEGKSEDEIKAKIVEIYISKGKHQTFAKRRAKSIYRRVLRMTKG